MQGPPTIPVNVKVILHRNVKPDETMTNETTLLIMNLDVTKPVFGVSDKVRLKSVSPTTETSQKIEILLVYCLKDNGGRHKLSGMTYTFLVVPR